MAWRCFFCDVVFTDEKKAGDHFGFDRSSQPVCVLDAEYLRDLEKQLACYRAEDSDADRKFHQMEADHAAALLHAEAIGYVRGLNEGKKIR